MLNESWASQTAELLDFIDVHGRVVVPKIARGTVYQSPAEALAAVRSG